jgi:F0F1-type ATP synthase delta subunit
MTNNPLQMKIAAPYANALFDFSKCNAQSNS